MLQLLRRLGSAGFARPAVEMLALTDLVVSNPARAGREFSQEVPRRFGGAASYFFAALSTGFILTQVAVTVLGIERVEHLSFWLLSVALIASIAVLASAIGAVLGVSGPRWLFVRAAMLAFGASFLIGSFVLAGASLTLACLRYVGFVPDFHEDLAAFQNFKKIGMQAYFDCLRGESVVYNVLYNGLGGAFEDLRDPIGALS